MDKKTFDSRGRRMHQFVSLWKKPLIFDQSNCNPGISSLSALFYLFSVKDYCRWQILIKTSSNAPTLPILHPVKILWPYPNVRLSVTLTTCVYYLSADSTSFGTARPTVFSRAHCKLMQTASPARRWRASSPPFFANFSPPAGAREHRAKVLWFCSIMFARTPSQLFEAFECQHHPAEVSHSQLWQLHADKIMTFRHQTIA